MKSDWPNVLSSVATAVAALAAVASWRASKGANRTSTSIAEIERERRHQELRPQFDVWCEEYSDSIFYLNLYLKGPSGLDQIDKLKISIRDNKRMSKNDPSGQRSIEEIQNQIWAPFRFSLGVDDSSENGRSVPYERLKLGEDCRFQLERTPPPLWNTPLGDRWWVGMGISRDLRISIECKNGELESWLIPWRLESPLEKAPGQGNVQGIS